MALAKVTLEGTADIDIPQLQCVCKHCGEHTSSGCGIELNFRDQKIYYMCQKCKKMNTMDLSKPQLPSLPRTRLS